jgi:hypothetical protein
MRRLITLAFLAVLASACGGGRTLAEINATPESKLFFPGSVVTERYGGDESCGIDTGCTSAFLDIKAKVSATSAEIGAWYQQKLGLIGWTQAPTPNPNDLTFTRGNYYLYRVTLGGVSDNFSYAIDYHICRMVLPADPGSLRFDC